MKIIIALVTTIMFLNISAYSQTLPKKFNYSLTPSESKQSLFNTIQDLTNRLEIKKLKNILSNKSAKILVAEIPAGFKSNMPTFKPDSNVHSHIKIINPSSL